MVHEQYYGAKIAVLKNSGEEIIVRELYRKVFTEIIWGQLDWWHKKKSSSFVDHHCPSSYLSLF